MHQRRGLDSNAKYGKLNLFCPANMSSQHWSQARPESHTRWTRRPLATQRPMAPKGTRGSPSQRAARLNRAAAVIRERADYILVCSALKKHSQLVAEHKRILMDAGAIAPDGLQVSESVGYMRAASPAAETSLARSSSRDAFEEDDALTESRRLQTLHANFQTWSQVPPTWFMMLFAAVEPVSLSANAMRGVIERAPKSLQRVCAWKCMSSSQTQSPTVSVARSAPGLTSFTCTRSATNRTLVARKTCSCRQIGQHRACTNAL